MKSAWVRRSAIGFGVVMLLLVAAAAWFVVTFDANRYKPLAIDWVQREYGRTLAIDGPVQLSVIPRLEVELSGLSLSERGSPKRNFATLKQAALSAQLLPLLRGQLVIDRVGARGLEVVLTRNAKGESNYADLVAAQGESKKPAAGGEGGNGPGFGFDVTRVQIDDFHASVRDDVIPLRGEVRLASLASGRLAPGVESPISVQARLALAEPHVAGELSGETKATFDPASGSTKLTAMKLAYKGDALGASAIDTVVRGALAYDAAQGMLQAAGLAAEGTVAFGALKLAKSRLAIDRFHYQPSRKALSLAKLQLEVSGSQGPDPLSLALDWPQLEATGDKLTGSAATGRFTLGGATTLNAKFESGPPSGSFEAIRLPGFTLAMKGASGPRQLDGNLKSDLLLRPEGPRVALEALNLKAQVIEPSLQPLALAVQGSASAGTAGAEWKLDGQLSGNHFASQGNAAFGKGPPNVQMQARFDSLDLNRLLAKPAKETAPSDNTGDAPIDLSALAVVNGNFALKATSFAWQQVRVADARIDASLANGTLQLANLSGKAWGGQIEASGSAEARANRVGVKLNANDVNVNALLKDLAASDRLEGTGHVSADLASRGKTVNEMRARLAGNAALQLRDGAIKGINLAKALREARAALRQDTTQRSSQTEQTDFTELHASFKVAEGVARNDDLEAKSPFLRLGGAGLIDLARERIDYTLKVTVTETTKGQGGVELAALRGVTVPVALSGPLAAVDWRIRWSAVAAQAVKGRIEEELQKRLRDKLGAPAPQGAASQPARPEDRLKDRLKGLLK